MVHSASRTLSDHIERWQFRPHPLAANGHTQTLAGLLWPRPLPPMMDRAEDLHIPAQEGALLARCHWLARRRTRPTLLLVHGLEGSDRVPYMLSMTAKALLLGWNVVRLNLRGCGESGPLSRTLYHAGRSEDLGATVAHLCGAEGLPSLLLCGFSLGGNLILKLLGEAAAALPHKVHAAAVISPAADLAASAAALDLPRNRLYRRFFLNVFRRRMSKARAHYGQRYDLDLLAQVRTIGEFDDRFVAPHFGFRGAADYYGKASAAPHLRAIRVPTLVLHAEDDPFVPLPESTRAALREGPATHLCMTRHGGHVGFLSAGQPGEDRLWAENRAIEFLTLVQRPTRSAPSRRP